MKVYDYGEHILFYYTDPCDARLSKTKYISVEDFMKKDSLDLYAGFDGWDYSVNGKATSRIPKDVDCHFRKLYMKLKFDCLNERNYYGQLS